MCQSLSFAQIYLFSLCTVFGSVHSSLGHHCTTPYYLPGSCPFKLLFSTSSVLCRFRFSETHSSKYPRQPVCQGNTWKLGKLITATSVLSLRFLHFLSNVCGLSIFPTDGVVSHDMDLVKLALQKQTFHVTLLDFMNLKVFFQTRCFFDSCDPYQDESLCTLFGFTIGQQYIIAFLRLTLWYLKEFTDGELKVNGNGHFDPTGHKQCTGEQKYVYLGIHISHWDY